MQQPVILNNFTFHNGDYNCFPGKYALPTTPRNMVMHFHDEVASSYLPVYKLQGLNICRGGLQNCHQMYFPVANDCATVGSSVTFPSFPVQDTFHQSIPAQNEFLYSNAVNPAETTCQSCKEKKREILSRQVADIVSRHGCLEVNSKEILGWYIMLSEEDRRIIKESGSLHRFLQDNTSVLQVKDKWVMLKGFLCKNLKKYSAKGHSLNKANQGTFHCVWSCENCGFINSLDMAVCKQCHSAAKQLEQSSVRADDFANSGSKIGDLTVDKNLTQTKSRSKTAVCSELMFCTSNIENFVSEENCQKKANTLYGGSQNPTAFEQKKIETCILKKASKGIQESDATKPVQLMDDHKLKEKYVISNTSTFRSIERIYATVGKLQENPADVQTDTWDTEKWEDFVLAPDSRHLFQSEPHRKSPSIFSYSEVESLDILSEKEKPPGPHQYPYEKPNNSILHQHKENVPNAWDVLEDSGITGDQVLCNESGCKECHEDLGQKEKPSLLQKYLTDYIKKDVSQECLPGDNFDDFFSVRSSSCCSICSNSSLPFSLDDLNDTEYCCFEEAVDGHSIQALNTLSKKPECMVSATSSSGSATFIPSTMVSEGVNTEVTGLNIPGLEEARANSKRTVFSNTVPSWILSCVTEEKESQTINTETQHVSVNTDLSLAFCSTTAQNILNERAGDSCGKDGLAVNWKAKSRDELMRRVLKTELQLLNTQRMFCRQLCCQAHQRSLEKQCALSLNGASFEQLTETSPLNLASVFSEVEEIYEKMKARILSGVALEDMVPLSAQLTKVDIAAEYPDFQPNVEVFKSICDGFVDKNKDTLISSLQAQDQSIKQKDNSPTLDATEDWFDAQENITVECPKDLSECIKELDKKEDVSEDKNAVIVMSSDLSKKETKKSASSQSRCVYVHVGNIAHSVTEENLLMHFEKYHVCKVFLQKLSMKSSYAVLTFDDASQAQAAVKEMDGKDLSGRKIKVRYIKESQDTVIEVFQTLIPDSTKTENQRPMVFASKPSSKNIDTRPILSKATPASRAEPQKTLSYKKPEDIAWNTQNYGRPVSQIVPYCAPPTSPNIFPPVPPWMAPSLLSSLVTFNSMHNPWIFTYSGPQYPPLYPPHAPVCAPFPPQASYMQAKSVQNSLGTITMNEKNDVCGSTKPSEPKKVSSKGSNILSSSVNNLMQMTQSLKEVPVSRAATVAAPVKMGTAQTEGPPFASNASSPKTKAPAKTTPAVLGKPSSADHLRVQSLDPISVATTEMTKTVEVTQISSTTVPLRAPSFLPLTVTIPKQGSSDTNHHYTEPLSDSPSAPTGHSSLNHPANASVAFKISSKPVSATKRDQFHIDEELKVLPELDLSSELPVNIIPNRLNLSSFDRLMTRLTALHPEVSSDEIVSTLQELRASRGGFLSGLSIEYLVRKVSSMLTNKPKV
eukprot:XP_017953039.1 PREDICTED: RNA-binding protein 44 isoform X1 [Xenopus tropicalis]